MATLPQHEFDFGTSLNLPTKDAVAPGSHRLDGCYVEVESGEATFVPPTSFLNQSPLWRLDVLQDLVDECELVHRHAIVEWAHSLSMIAPETDGSRCLEAYRSMCDQMGVQAPENLEALLVLSERLKAGL